MQGFIQGCEACNPRVVPLDFGIFLRCPRGIHWLIQGLYSGHIEETFQGYDPGTIDLVFFFLFWGLEPQGVLGFGVRCPGFQVFGALEFQAVALGFVILRLEVMNPNHAGNF